MQEDKNRNESSTEGEQNPTLKEAGATVSDYGNVMGGSSDAGQEEEGTDVDKDNSTVAPAEED